MDIESVARNDIETRRIARQACTVMLDQIGAILNMLDKGSLTGNELFHKCAELSIENSNLKEALDDAAKDLDFLAQRLQAQTAGMNLLHSDCIKFIQMIDWRKYDLPVTNRKLDDVKYIKSTLGIGLAEANEIRKWLENT